MRGHEKGLATRAEWAERARRGARSLWDAGHVRERVAALPLRWRLALGYALVLLLVLAPLAAVQAVAIHGQLYDDAAKALQVAARAAATTPSRGPKAGLGGKKGDALSTDELAQRVARQQGFDTIILNTSGQVLGSAEPNGDAVPDAARLVDRAHVDQLLMGQSSNIPFYAISTAGGRYLVALAALPAGPPAPKGVPKAAPPGPGASTAAGNQTSRQVLALARDLSPIDRTTTFVWTLSLAGTALALLIATALGALLVRRALRPLTRVAGAAHAIAAGDYARRVVAPPAHDEVGRLAVAFNTMAEAVEDAFATQRRFVADAAHELRTPLTALGGYADVLLLGAAHDPRELTAALEAMRGETHRMARLVNDLLALARLESGRLTVQPGEVDLAALLGEAGRGAQLLYQDRHIALDLPVRPVIVRGDRDRLHQVMANLLDNAVKFTEPGGHIGLALRQEARDAVIDVCDDGVGIAVEDLPHVFERFYRADKARSRATGGTGLGLSIAQAIAAAHDGSLSVSSRPGRGTTVTVRLPTA